MKVLALHNLKGGVGKTTAAVHLAHLSARAGRSTLLWDLDAQGASSWFFRVRVAESTRPRRLLRDRVALWGAIRGSDWPGLDVLPADLSLQDLELALHDEPEPERALGQALADLGRHYERVWLDCAPGLSRLAQCVFRVADALVVPTIPTTLSLRTLADLYKHLKPERERGLLMLPFFSIVDGRKAMHRDVREFARAQELGFLTTEIPYSAQVERTAARREPLTAGAASDGAQAFEALAREVDARLADVDGAPKLRRARLLEFLQSQA